jgi:hypothetical protein
LNSGQIKKFSRALPLMNEPIKNNLFNQSVIFKRMSRFRTDSTIKKRKKSLIGEVVEVIQSGLDAAFDEIIHDISSKKKIKKIKFS